MQWGLNSKHWTAWLAGWTLRSRHAVLGSRQAQYRRFPFYFAPDIVNIYINIYNNHYVSGTLCHWLSPCWTENWSQLLLLWESLVLAGVESTLLTDLITGKIQDGISTLSHIKCEIYHTHRHQHLLCWLGTLFSSICSDLFLIQF